MKVYRLSLVIALILALPSGVSAENNQPSNAVGRQIEVNVEPQAWQVRRAVFVQTVKDINSSQGRDAAALARFDGLLTSFEKAPYSLTPMEAMDYYGIFYVPREGATKMPKILQMVTLFAVLGWYDALRFGEESGRAEIISNEFFFIRPFRLAGREHIKQSMDFLVSNPQEAAEAVQTGIAYARNARGKVQYDEQWPTAYGLQRLTCGMEGRKDCPKPPALPQEQWDAAFEQAISIVEHYYRNNASRKN